MSTFLKTVAMIMTPVVVICVIATAILSFRESTAGDLSFVFIVAAGIIGFIVAVACGLIAFIMEKVDDKYKLKK